MATDRMPAQATPGFVAQVRGALERAGDRFLATGLQAYAMIGVLIVLAILFHALTDGIFLSERNVSLVLRQSAVLAIVAAGMVLLLVAREIDLSVGSAVALTGIVAAELQVQEGWGVAVTVVATIAAGLVMGAWQGFWVARFLVPSFVVSLVGLLVWRGLGFLWTDAATISPMDSNFVWLSEGFVSPVGSVILLVGCFGLWLVFSLRGRLRSVAAGLSERSLSRFAARAFIVAAATAFLAWAAWGFRGLPMAVVIMGAVVLILTWVMRYTTFGRSLYAIGGNREASRLAGLNIGRSIFITFCIMGVLYGIAGVLLTARLNGAPPNTGLYLELDAIAAAVIGGASLAGGIGTVPGALVGALLLTTLDNGMSLMNVSSFLQLVVKGFVLLLAVWLDVASRRRRAR